MSLRKKLGSFIRDKLGITETRMDVSYLNTYVNLALPECIHLNEETLAFSKAEIERRYGVKDFKPVIHKNDIMLQYHIKKMPENVPEAIFHYFNVGLNALSKISAHIPDSTKIGHILDFGAGYARGSRFISSFYKNAKISVSEIKPQAMAFQAGEFGFNTMSHNEKATSFTEGNFDLIIAISVFSHLPEALFKDWLQKLYSCLNEGGAFVFTYNDVRNWPSMSGPYNFITQSEDKEMRWVSDRITRSEIYGSTFYSTEYIADIIKEETGAHPEFVTDFSGKQDAVILRK